MTMKNKCGNCARYVQHFAIFDGRLTKIVCGHCMDKKRKKTEQEMIACEEFVAGESVDNKMVRREYLTKELLQKVLSLELWENEE